MSTEVRTDQNTKKRLLIYAHYYVPDVASTGQILKELVDGLKDYYEITVICTVPSYNGRIPKEYRSEKYYRETIDGVTVLRTRVPAFTKVSKLSRVKNILTYYLGACKLTKMAGDQDYVFAISQPPILGGMLGVYGKRKKKAKLIYNIQDFNPEQVKAVKYSKSKLLIDVMMWMDKRSCRNSDVVITVGRDLVETMKYRFRNAQMPRTELINNWIDEEKIYPLPLNNADVARFRRDNRLEDKFVIAYSGNLGLYYDLNNILEVIERIKPGTKTNDGRDVAFLFIGAGSQVEKLQDYAVMHYMTNVYFLPYQNKEELVYSLNAADVHWCVNAKGIKGVSCPSKYYGIAAVGKPVLAVLEPESEIRMIIEESKSGLVCDPGDYEQIYQNICWFIQHADNEELNVMGKRGREYLESRLTKDISIKKYLKIICDL